MRESTLMDQVRVAELWEQIGEEELRRLVDQSPEFTARCLEETL